MGTSAPSADPRDEDGVELHRLVEEQAALRRVATLVASGARDASPGPGTPNPPRTP